MPFDFIKLNVVISLQITMSVVTIMVDVPMSVSTCWLPIVVNVLLDILYCLTNVTALKEVIIKYKLAIYNYMEM